MPRHEVLIGVRARANAGGPGRRSRATGSRFGSVERGLEHCAAGKETDIGAAVIELEQPLLGVSVAPATTGFKVLSLGSIEAAEKSDSR
jgi:hypothetical protein